MPYNSDVPIYLTEDDQFGLDSFARRLARAVRAAQLDNNVVVGLNGAWGSGKTSAINMAVSWFMAMEAASDELDPLIPNEEKETEAYKRFFDQKLDRDLSASDKLEALKVLESKWGEGEGETIVIRYNPWLVSGHETLISDFFRIFGERVAAHAKPDLADQIRDSSREIALFTERVSGAVDGGLRLAALGADLLGGAGAASASYQLVSNAAQAARNASKQTQKKLERRNDLTLQEVRQKLKNQLRKLKKSFLVIVDDIDRLETTEVRPLLSMVKSVGDLPNVTYLLGFDRALVDAALFNGRKHEGDAPSFLEKILQLDIDLPRVPIGYLIAELCRWLPQVLHRDLQDWERRNIELDFLLAGEFLETPRDLMRLKNAILFVRVSTGKELRINDVIRMEAIRVKEKGLFSWLMRHPATVGPMSAEYGYGLHGEDRKLLLSKILEQASERRRSACGVLLGRTLSAFSEVSEVARDVIDTDKGDSNRSWPIDSSEGWHGYAQLYPHEGTLSQEEWEYINRIRGDKTKCAVVLSELKKRSTPDGRTMQASLVEDLQRFVRSENGVAPIGLLLALVECDDSLFRGRMYRMGITPGFVLTHLIDLIPEDERAKTLNEIVSNRSSKLGAVCFIVDQLRKSYSSIVGESSERLAPTRIPEEGVLELSLSVSTRIAGSSCEDLASGCMVFPVFELFAMIQTDEEAKGLARHCFDNQLASATKIIEVLATYHSSSRGSFFSFQGPIDAKIYPLIEMKEYALKRLEARGVEDDRQLLEAFVETMNESALHSD